MSSHLEPVRTAVYLRISRDPNDRRTGVARQAKDCQAIAADLGWSVVETFDENNTSATRGTRPEYQRLVAAIRSGRITAVVFWEQDRYSRSVRETEDLLDMAQKFGVRAASSSGGEIDLTSPTGRYNTTMAGAAARKETEQMSKRLKRAFDQKAAAGQPHGAAPYGWRREKELDRSGSVIESHDVLDEAQAQVIRDAVAMLRAGTSLRASAKALNDRGLSSPRLSHKDENGERHPLPWASATLKQVLLRARNAGLRTHRGAVLDGVTGEWPPIFDGDTYHWLVATLNDPRRKTTKGSARRHLLTGIAICGRCGSNRMVVNVGRRLGADGKHQPPGYTCQACTRVRRKQSDVDAVVDSYMINLLKQPGALDKLVTGDPDEVARARKVRDDALARMEYAADAFGHGRWSAAQVERVNAIAEPEIADATARITANQPAELPVHLAGPNAAADWEDAELEEKRTLILALTTITIMPSGPGRTFDPRLIRIDER